MDKRAKDKELGQVKFQIMNKKGYDKNGVCITVEEG